MEADLDFYGTWTHGPLTQFTLRRITGGAYRGSYFQRILCAHSRGDFYHFFFKKIYSSPKDMLKERKLGEGLERERGREKHRCEKETLVGCLLYMSQPRMEPTTQVCAMTRIRTSDLLVLGTMLNQAIPV